MYSGSIYLFCCRIFIDQKISEETTRRVFNMAWENIRQVRSDSSFSSWITGIAVYKIVEYIREKYNSFDELKRNKISSENRIIDQSLSGFEKMILRLDDDERILFILHDVNKYSYEEIADLFTFSRKEEIVQIIKTAREKLVQGLLYELQ